MKSSLKGALLASAVATLFATGVASAAEKDAKAAGHEVKCAGVNACAGKGACGMVKNTCAGKNGCKGQGWVKEKSAQACTDKGGKVMTPSKE